MGQLHSRNRSSCPLRPSFAASAFTAAGVFAILPYARTSHFTRLGRVGECHRYHLLVHIQADVGDKLLQDPSPMHEARHRPSPAQPSLAVYCKTGPPYLRPGLVRQSEQARVKSAYQSLRKLIVKADWSDEAVHKTSVIQLTSSGMALSVSLVREASSAAPQHQSKTQIVTLICWHPRSPQRPVVAVWPKVFECFAVTAHQHRMSADRQAR
jgi:hypothetical protein